MQYKNNDEIREYFKLLRKGHTEYREKIIVNYLDLVYSIINEMKLNDDFFSDGCIGLIKAVDSYDTNKDVKFITYATKCIRNYIITELRNNSENVKTFSLNDAINVNNDGDSTTIEDTLYDEEYDVLNNYLLKEEYDELRLILSNLNEKELTIINLYYGFNCERLTQKEIALIFNTSSANISRLIKKIEAKLRIQYKNKILTKHK